MPKKSRRAHGRKKKEAPGPFTAAGLIRFYEEADVGIRMKPQVLIAIALIFTAIIIVLEKIL
ncbi:Sec61beta family protein [Staphylothermus hellenicus DSM 12710]|uniref:Preprotein translocase subunit SecG n=1 Tax=Staphylothermus hellenicus (strain DSM 12710 / JCM 10830 / BK20S6-10-b1 / P8) TaxID=591019 RepID=D7D9V8_STAHD|nr:preprotein translocase subunit Sec61beta [Staphylothermus hellenicus]ADI32554.1 Sec61beta family protein [Staphylothermus hellenicus DSM 12710]